MQQSTGLPTQHRACSSPRLPCPAASASKRKCNRCKSSIMNTSTGPSGAQLSSCKQQRRSCQLTRADHKSRLPLSAWPIARAAFQLPVVRFHLTGLNFTNLNLCSVKRREKVQLNCPWWEWCWEARSLSCRVAQCWGSPSLGKQCFHRDVPFTGPVCSGGLESGRDRRS